MTYDNFLHVYKTHLTIDRDVVIILFSLSNPTSSAESCLGPSFNIN